MECKEVVKQYGELILELLVAQVCSLFFYSFIVIDVWIIIVSPIRLSLFFYCDLNVFEWLQTRPDKVCSKIGLCIFDGARYVGLVNHNRSPVA